MRLRITTVLLAVPLVLAGCSTGSAQPGATVTLLSPAAGSSDSAGSTGAAGPRPTSTSSAETGFWTPSTNIACSLGSAGVRCDAMKRTFTPPPKPADCQFDWGTAVQLAPGSPGRLACISDVSYDGADGKPDWFVEGVDTATRIGSSRGYVLGYGHTIVHGSIRCVVARTKGVTCSTSDGHGFTLSNEAYRTW